MKRNYEHPQVIIEMFSPNIAIASSCGINTNVIFDCMQGNEKDETQVLSSAAGITGCGNNAGWAPGVAKATNPTGRAHSTFNTNLDWSTSGGGQTATAKNNPTGMLYICAYVEENKGPGQGGGVSKTTFDTVHWSTSSDLITHNQGNDGRNCKHPMIAPVYGDVSGVSTGS